MRAVLRTAGVAEIDHLDRSLEAPSGTYAALLDGPAGAGCELLVAEVDGVAVGAVLLRGATDRAAVRARWGALPEISDLLVHPEERGDGYGTGLVEAACARVAARGGTRVGLGVADDNPRAARLYLRLGFAKTGLGFVDHDAQGAVQYLVRDLA